MKPLAYSARAASRALGVNKNRIYRALQRGDLVSHRVGNRMLITTDELLRWLKAQPTGRRRVESNEQHIGA